MSDSRAFQLKREIADGNRNEGTIKDKKKNGFVHDSLASCSSGKSIHSAEPTPQEKLNFWNGIQDCSSDSAWRSFTFSRKQSMYSRTTFSGMLDRSNISAVDAGVPEFSSLRHRKASHIEDQSEKFEMIDVQTCLS